MKNMNNFTYIEAVRKTSIVKTKYDDADDG